MAELDLHDREDLTDPDGGVIIDPGRYETNEKDLPRRPRPDPSEAA